MNPLGGAVVLQKKVCSSTEQSSNSTSSVFRSVCSKNVELKVVLASKGEVHIVSLISTAAIAVVEVVFRWQMQH